MTGGVKDAIVLTIVCYPALSDARTKCYREACQTFSEATVLKTFERLIADGLVGYHHVVSRHPLTVPSTRSAFRPDLTAWLLPAGRAWLETQSQA